MSDILNVAAEEARRERWSQARKDGAQVQLQTLDWCLARIGDDREQGAQYAYDIVTPMQILEVARADATVGGRDSAITRVVVDVLAEACREASDAAKPQYLEALAALAPWSAECWAVIREHMASEDAPIRASATRSFAAALESVGSGTSLEVRNCHSYYEACKLLPSLARDSNDEVRQAAAAALGTDATSNQRSVFGLTGSVRSAAACLCLLERDENEQVRTTAACQLVKLGIPSSRSVEILRKSIGQRCLVDDVIDALRWSGGHGVAALPELMSLLRPDSDWSPRGSWVIANAVEAMGAPAAEALPDLRDALLRPDLHDGERGHIQRAIETISLLAERS